MFSTRHSALSVRGLRAAEKHLSLSCPIMARLVAAHGPCSLIDREFRPFHTLVTSIISQQLSSKAANTIEGRVLKLVPDFAPNEFLKVPLDALRNAGLSAAKARYILTLADRVNNGQLNVDALTGQPNEDVIAALTALPGIGLWTAEMFLIFGLRRPDVLALGDAGLHRAARMLYGSSNENGLLERVSSAWRPYRSVASWYLWKHLDVV